MSVSNLSLDAVLIPDKTPYTLEVYSGLDKYDSRILAYILHIAWPAFRYESGLSANLMDICWYYQARDYLLNSRCYSWWSDNHQRGISGSEIFKKANEIYQREIPEITIVFLEEGQDDKIIETNDCITLLQFLCRLDTLISKRDQEGRSRIRVAQIDKVILIRQV